MPAVGDDVSARMVAPEEPRRDYFPQLGYRIKKGVTTAATSPNAYAFLAALGAMPFTAGMSLLPAMAAEGAAAGSGTLMGHGVKALAGEPSGAEEVTQQTVRNVGLGLLGPPVGRALGATLSAVRRPGAAIQAAEHLPYVGKPIKIARMFGRMADAAAEEPAMAAPAAAPATRATVTRATIPAAELKPTGLTSPTARIRQTVDQRMANPHASATELPESWKPFVVQAESDAAVNVPGLIGKRTLRPEHAKAARDVYGSEEAARVLSRLSGSPVSRADVLQMAPGMSQRPTVARMADLDQGFRRALQNEGIDLSQFKNELLRNLGVQK
jgi:hypothetical protein